MTKTMAQRIAERVVLGVCELPDYNSPEDQPDLVMCTVQQLEHCVLQAFEQLEYDREMERGPPVEPSEVYDKIGVLRPDGEFTTYEGCEGEPVYVRRALKSNPAPETSGGYACMNCAGAGCSDCTPALQSNPPRLPCIYREGCKNYDHCLAAGHCHPL